MFIQIVETDGFAIGPVFQFENLEFDLIIRHTATELLVFTFALYTCTSQLS